MKKNLKKMFVAGFAFLAAGAIFSMSVNDSSLGSLSATAGTKCVEATNCDCKSPSTGNIYTGYKAAEIGGEEEVSE